MSNNTFLFVDGSNLYGSQFALFGPKKFLSFNDLIIHLEKLLKISFNKIFFYASFSPIPKNATKKQKYYLKNEALFYKNVRKTPSVDFFKGYRSPTSGKEKEVDVKLAVDMVDMAHRNKYQKMFLISGDADFLHALFAVEKINKQVQLICMENKIMFKASFYFKTNIITREKLSRISSKYLSKHLHAITSFKYPLIDIN